VDRKLRAVHQPKHRLFLFKYGRFRIPYHHLHLSRCLSWNGIYCSKCRPSTIRYPCRSHSRLLRTIRRIHKHPPRNVVLKLHRMHELEYRRFRTWPGLHRELHDYVCSECRLPYGK
jgi:hypothetical protein